VPKVLRDAWEEYDDWVEAGRPCLGVPFVNHSSIPESAGFELDGIQRRSPELGGNTSMTSNPSPISLGTQGQGKGDAQGCFGSRPCAICHGDGARGIVRESGAIYLHPECERDWEGKL
jgi:hypothetical protein